MLDDPTELKIVVIGGGSGTSAVLRGLKHCTSKLSAVVTMFDSGGSSGLLQAEFGYLPMGDLRQCLLGLTEDTESNRALRELLDFRFRQQSSLNGHSLGNLLLAALTTIGEDLEMAVDEMSRLLQITGKVIPVALEHADLCAELSDGHLLRGESTIDLRGQSEPFIERVFLDPSVVANPRGVRAIMEADVVLLGPGDLYTSIIPNLLVEGIPEAIAETQAIRIYACNLMTKLGETDGFKASNFVREIIRYLAGSSLDWVLINTGRMSQEAEEAYRDEGAYPVVPDLDATKKLVSGVFATPLGNNQVPMKHESERVAEATLSIARVGRVPPTVSRVESNGHSSPARVPSGGPTAAPIPEREAD